MIGVAVNPLPFKLLIYLALLKVAHISAAVVSGV